MTQFHSGNEGTSYIWIIGSSIITHVEEAAYAKNQGKLQLEGRPLVWKQGNALERPAPRVQWEMLIPPLPVKLVIHVEGNDLVNIRQAKMMKRITKDIKYIHSVFPSSYLEWSDILPCSKWLGLRPTAKNISQMDIKRRRINCHGRRVVHQYDLGRTISHELDVDVPGFFKNDGTHLTAIGNSIFLLALQKGIKSFFSNNEKKSYDAKE